MSACLCECPLNLGCFNVCFDSILPLEAVQEGLHNIKIHQSYGLFRIIPIDIDVTNEFIIPANKLPEVGVTKFNIIQPDGSLFADGEGNTCFSIQTYYDTAFSGINI